MSMPDQNINVGVSATFPGEALAIKLIDLFEKLIDGQTPEQKAKLWDNWIKFWQPFVDLVSPK